jgi:Mrp family chromosome partitioning ATPase
MSSLSTESTPRERLARLVTLLCRTRMFWRSAASIAALGLGISLVLALRAKRDFRSETTVLYRDGLQAQQGEAEPQAQRAARMGPKLRDLLYARPTLEQVIREHDLFPEKTRRSMIDGIEEMTTAVGFRARAGDSYVISFTYDDPAVARHVAARLAELMITEYNRHNLDTATLTRDFLRRKLEEASGRVDDESRKLSEFLAQHPQFQWGAGDSPYAPGPGGPPLAAPTRAAPRAAPTPGDPLLRALERDLGRLDAELYAPAPGVPAPAAATPATQVEAQKQRDAAAAALGAAQAALAEKMLSVTAVHPDAVSARARVEAARQALAAADAASGRARLGVPQDPTATREPLTPARRAELERQRTALRRQVADRRAELGSPAGAPATGAAAPGGPADTVELETEWQHLRLALERARDALHTIQQNARAADLSADAVARQGHEAMEILEPAYLPTRPDRGRGRVFFAGAAITLFLALAYAAARVLLDDRLRDEGDVAALGGPPVLVAMPRLPEPAARRPERAIVPAVRAEDDPDADDLDPPSVPSVITPPPEGSAGHGALMIRFGAAPPEPLDPLSARPLARLYPVVEAVFDDPEVEVIGADVSEGGQPGLLEGAAPDALSALRVLRHRLEQRRGDGAFVVSVMSPGRGEGKTALAVRLALTLSEAERARVILVEGHFDSPGLCAALGLRLPPEAGFSAQLRERMNGHGIPWGVVRLGPSLSLLAEPGERAAHPKAIHSSHFEAALGALRRSYEYVIIDGPPIVGSGDANVLEAVSDGVLVVVRAASTGGAALTRATQQLGSARVLGVVLNDVAAARAPRPVLTEKPA